LLLEVPNLGILCVVAQSGSVSWISHLLSDISLVVRLGHGATLLMGGGGARGGGGGITVRERE